MLSTATHACPRPYPQDNAEKIKQNKVLPYLVGNVVELLDVEPEDGQEEDGGNTDLDSERKGKCAVIKTVSPPRVPRAVARRRHPQVQSPRPANPRAHPYTKAGMFTLSPHRRHSDCHLKHTTHNTHEIFLCVRAGGRSHIHLHAHSLTRTLCHRLSASNPNPNSQPQREQSTRQTIFLPVIGLVPAEDMKPGDLVGVNKDSYLILDTLPCEYDSRVKAMEVDEKPEEEYTDIGGLDKQIQELVEAIVLPMTHKERFIAIGIKPPKGCLMYGPPGTGTFVDGLAFGGSRVCPAASPQRAPRLPPWRRP